MLPAIAKSTNGQVVALASRTAGRAEKMLEPYSGARVCASYGDLIQQPDIDALYIPLVNHLHHEWSIRSLEAGKHVLCEKPLAMNAREAEEMAAACHRSGKLLMEAFMYRFHPDTRAFVESIHDPLHVQASFGFRLTDLDNYRLRAELGGGALLDVGCYCLSISRWILGEPARVSARAHRERGVDMSVTALLEFGGGRTASIFASFESPEEQELRVIARDGVYERHRPFGSRRDAHDPYRLMVESFGESILSGAPQAIPLGESIANMRALDDVRAAFSA